MGSTFTVRLPVAQSNEAPTDLATLVTKQPDINSLQSTVPQ
jgi:hypothetical protein